jgi:CRP-like cAMP-binding protein
VGEPNAEGKVVELVGPGDYIGLAATALGAAQTFSAEALVESRLLLISRNALLECAAANADFGLQLVMTLSREVCALTADIEAFALHLGRERVASYLLQIAATDEPCMLPAKKSIIASRLSVTPEYFSRMLHDFIAIGAIAVKGSQITILNRETLREAAEGGRMPQA